MIFFHIFSVCKTLRITGMMGWSWWPAKMIWKRTPPLLNLMNPKPKAPKNTMGKTAEAMWNSPKDSDFLLQSMANSWCLRLASLPRRQPGMVFLRVFSTRNGSGLCFRRIAFQHQTGVCQDSSASRSSRLKRIIWALKNSMFLLDIQTPKK